MLKNNVLLNNILCLQHFCLRKCSEKAFTLRIVYGISSTTGVGFLFVFKTQKQTGA